MEIKPKKSIRTDRKKGVPFKVMFRHHMDPAYYDPKANDKIFVPDVEDVNRLSEAQRKIIESFPERDRGLYNKEGSTKDPTIETDALEAAVKKMKIRKEQRRKEKATDEGGGKESKKKDRKVRFNDEQSDTDSAEYFEDSQDEGQ